MGRGSESAAGGGIQPNRAFILAVGSACAMGCGAVYIWSIFNKPLMALHGFTTSEVTFAYSLFLIATCFSSMMAGWLQRRFPARFIVLAAGSLFGLGWLLTGFADSVPLLYLFFGGFAGLGNGLMYNTIVSVVTRWYPDKKGFANGVCIGAIGLAPAVFAPIGNVLIELFDVSMAFHLVGVFWLVIYGTLSWFLRLPPSSAAASEDDATSNADVGCEAETPSLTTKQMLRQPLYYVVFLLFAASSMSGYLITGHASNIGQDMAGLTASEGAIMVAVMAVGSFCGRFGFGALSDKIGRYWAIGAALVLNAVNMLFFIGQAHTFMTFLAAVTLAGACFGASMSIVPTMVADSFGPAHFGQNYSLVFPGCTLAGLIGPTFASASFEAQGSFYFAFVASGVVSLFGIVLAVAGALLARRLAKSL